MAEYNRQQPSVMQHQFSQVPRAEIPRSAFDRSHGYKTTFDAGYLVPIFVDEALPGDTFNLRMSGLCRLATPLHPFMDNLQLTTFFFAVPIRLIWENWERMNGAQDDPDDSTDYTTPVMTGPPAGYDVGDLSDYMGIPTGVGPLEHSVFWHRAYNLIWNEWFRDQNLQDRAYIDRSDGPESAVDGNYPLRRRGKRHDYFTSCLPWPQKGPSVSLPIGDEAPVRGIGTEVDTVWNQSDTIREYPGQTRAYASYRKTQSDPGGAIEEDPNNPGFPRIYADLSEATAATINELRQAFQIQRLYERDARGGTRYTEIILSHFGVSSPDARLQRPEYLGGGRSHIYVAPVAQSSSTADSQGPVDTPQGNLAGVGTAAIDNHGFTKSFTEHCILIGMVSANADLTYQQGLNRMFSRGPRFDYYWPALSHIGEQAVANKEIFADGTAADDETFGYQERYAEYRYKPSQITGQFRSAFAQSLDTWHLAQDFAVRPALSSDFIEDDPPVDRVIAVVDEPHFLLDIYFGLRCARPMPVYGVPGLIDHF